MLPVVHSVKVVWQFFATMRMLGRMKAGSFIQPAKMEMVTQSLNKYKNA